MISSRPTIPLLVHEDCMEGIQLGLANQQASLSQIKDNTYETADTLDSIRRSDLRNINEAVNDNRAALAEIGRNTSSIQTSSSNTATATSSLYSSVGTTTDASTENTVIGLLKSIANKL